MGSLIEVAAKLHDSIKLPYLIFIFTFYIKVFCIYMVQLQILIKYFFRIPSGSFGREFFIVPLYF